MRTAKKKSKPKPPELKVVFDSNAIYSQTGSYLLKHEIYELIKANSQHTDLIITWHLPETVRHERQYQLLKQSLDLVPSIQKLEKLLGHNLLITDQIITQRVHEGIEKQIEDLKITVLPTDPTKVDWNKVMLDAAYRRPPFSVGEKEKGFRDALIAEAFFQLVESSPKTPRVCRIALITGDGLLTETVKALTVGASNVRILPTLEELKGLINTLVSEVEEAFVEKIKGSASAFFFESGQQDSLYFKENIWNKLSKKFRNELHGLPEGADEREHVKTLIGAPRFKKKEGQRIYWVSRITIQVQAYKYEPVYTTTPSAIPITAAGISSGSIYASPDLSQQSVDIASGIVRTSDLASLFSKPAQGPLNLFTSPRSKSLFKNGEIVFEITWSVAVTTTKRLNTPRIESVEYVETTWE